MDPLETGAQIPLEALSPGMRLLSIELPGGPTPFRLNIHGPTELDFLARSGARWVYAQQGPPPSPLQDTPKEKGLKVQIASCLEGVLMEVLAGFAVDLVPFEALLRRMVRRVVDQPSALPCFLELDDTDHDTFLHCVHVGLLSVAFGSTLGATEEELVDWAMGAMVHDVGKVRIDLEILNKPGNLDAYELASIRHHPLYSAELLSEAGAFPAEVLAIAAQHHERWDGLGYPFGLPGSALSEAVQVVSLCDCLDALTARRAYKEPYPLEISARMLLVGKETLFKPSLVDAFFERMGIFLLGAVVEVEGHGYAFVEATHPRTPARPLLRVVAGPGQRPLGRPYSLDLAAPAYSGVRVLRWVREQEWSGELKALLPAHFPPV